MDLTGILGVSPQESQAPAGAPLDKDAFMQLLVHQLRNQDPLEPVANEDFIAQLATFSNLEEMEQLNENIVSMVLLQQSNALLQQLTDSSALIGRSVTYEDATTGDILTGVVDSVKIEGGLAYLNVGGASVPLPSVFQVNGADTTESDTTTEQGS